MLRAVVCEDNPISLKKICASVERVFTSNRINGSVVCRASNTREIEDYLKHHTANLFLLDIDLKTEETGYMFAQRLREKDPFAYIIFLTGHFEYALQAFKVKTFDFLTKPITDEILEQCLLRVNKDYLSTVPAAGDKESIIEVKSGNAVYRLKTNDIVYVEKLGFKVILHLVGSELSCYDTLENIAAKLVGGRFVRCHKSYIANTSYISKIDYKEKQVLFETGLSCYIGDKYKGALSSCDTGASQ